MAYKIVAVGGSQSAHSYNQFLIDYLKNTMSSQLQIHTLTVDQLPFLTPHVTSAALTDINYVRTTIKDADGLLIATAEINHSMPANLKNMIDWCSLDPTVLTDKPIMLIGASTGPLGTIRAQLHLREVLTSPAINSRLTHKSECLIANAATQFDTNNRLINTDTKKILHNLCAEFITLIENN